MEFSLIQMTRLHFCNSFQHESINFHYVALVCNEPQTRQTPTIFVLFITSSFLCPLVLLRKLFIYYSFNND